MLVLSSMSVSDIEPPLPPRLDVIEYPDREIADFGVLSPLSPLWYPSVIPTTAAAAAARPPGRVAAAAASSADWPTLLVVCSSSVTPDASTATPVLPAASPARPDLPPDLR